MGGVYLALLWEAMATLLGEELIMRNQAEISDSSGYEELPRAFHEIGQTHNWTSESLPFKMSNFLWVSRIRTRYGLGYRGYKQAQEEKSRVAHEMTE